MTKVSLQCGSLRVLVVGLGSAGKRHAENLLSLGVGEVIACSEWRRLDQVSIGDRRLRTVNSFDLGLDDRPDAVVLANPTSLHAAYLEKALLAGCDVYVEKPLADSKSRLERAREITRSSKRVVAVGNQMRFNTCLERLRELLHSGTLGQILHVHVDMGEYLPDYHPGEDYRQSYAAKKELGGGVLSTQIHDVNYLHWLFGPFRSVYAAGGKVSDLAIDVEDSVSFLLKTDRFGITVHVDYLQRQPRRTLTITGEFGTASWNYYKNTLTVDGRDGRLELGNDRPVVRNEMFLKTLSEFLTCSCSGGRPRTDFWDGYMDVTVVEAVHRSLLRDTSIRLEYDQNVD